LTGAAYVYTRSASIWSQQQRLAASDAAQFDQFGYSVALSSDGNTALVGALSKAAGAGATYAFIRSSSTWAEQQKLTAVNAAKGDNFGDAVTLSGDAGTALIGANGKTSLTGAAYVFTQSAGSGSQLVLSGYPASTPSGSPFSLTVSIQNGSGQPLPSYVGTVHLTSSDPQASLPSDYTFTPADAGTHTFSVTLNTPGRNAQQSQTITVTDTVTTTLTATTTPITVTSLTTAPTVTQGWYLIGGSPLSLWPGATNVFSWNALTGQWFTPTGNEPPGTGAWEFVASQATNTITVQRCARSITLTVQVRRWNMVGNPCDATVTLPTGTRVLLWDSTHQRYLPATTIPPGEGAWILPLAGPLPLTPS
jgi:hypothetical protein